MHAFVTTQVGELGVGLEADFALEGLHGTETTTEDGHISLIHKDRHQTNMKLRGVQGQVHNQSKAKDK